MVLASKLTQPPVFCDQQVSNQTVQDGQIFVTETTQPSPTLTFPNALPIVRKRRKPSARKAAVAFGYNPLLSPIVEDRFAELASPDRAASIFSLGDGSAPPSPSPSQDGAEQLVETESASAGELVVIASHFAARPFFQKYSGRLGNLPEP